MLIELAIGDAYGAGFEYAPSSFVKKYNDLSGYVQHKWHELTPGCYTDDTQMSLAIAELIISKKVWTPHNIVDSFIKTFRRDQRKGYSNHFYQFLCSVKNIDDFIQHINKESDSSGAAMRSAPIGCLPDIDQVIEYATIQAETTHRTAGGVQSSVAAALSSHFFIYRYDRKRNLGKFLQQYVPGKWNMQFRGKVGTKGLESVHAATTAIMISDRMSTLLIRCIANTGDTDTVAAIALAAGSQSREIRQDLPPTLYENLENHAYGADYLSRLDRQLDRIPT